jgi:hypothetical protein
LAAHGAPLKEKKKTGAKTTGESQQMVSFPRAGMIPVLTDAEILLTSRIINRTKKGKENQKTNMLSTWLLKAVL